MSAPPLAKVPLGNPLSRRILSLMQGLGFDGPRLAFSMRTAAVACIAMLCAWALGLDHPQWSAMTVWAASQPTRGRLVEKSLFRLAGTFSGVCAGVVLVLVSASEPWILLGGLALWIGLCVAIGNLQRGFVSYGTILAGYSAAMVILLDYGRFDQILVLADDRFLTILTGVVSAVIFGLILTPHAAEGNLDGRLRLLTARLLDQVAGRLLDAGVSGEKKASEASAILSEIAALEDMLDPHSGGFFRSRLHVRHCRRLLNEAVALLLWLAEGASGGDQRAFEAADRLRRAALILREGPLTRDRLRAINGQLHRVASLRRYSALGEALAGLHQALEGLQESITADRARSRGLKAGLFGGGHHPIVLHRDWLGALRAGVRASVVLVSVAMVWQATGIAAGAYLMLGTSIMISLFSTFDSPSLMMRGVFLGSLAGALLALLWRMLVWPMADSLFMAMMLLMPVVVIGALVMAHRSTLKMAMDFCMISLLCLQPVFPIPQVPGEFLQVMMAVVLAPLVALVAYGYVLPSTVQHRREALKRVMIAELGALAGAKRIRPMVWRSRLYHRLIKLHRWSEQTPNTGRGTHNQWTAEALTITTLGYAVLAVRDYLEQVALEPMVRRRLEMVLARVQSLSPSRTRQWRHRRQPYLLLMQSVQKAAQSCTHVEPELAVILDRSASQLALYGKDLADTDSPTKTWPRPVNEAGAR